MRTDHNWEDIPAMIPFRRRHGIYLTPAFVLEAYGCRGMDGHTYGRKAKARLWLSTPEGRLKKLWSARFDVPAPHNGTALRIRAVETFLENAKTDPRLSHRVTIQSAIETAREILSELNAEQKA